ncbi:MAG: hypothetical protein O2931_00790 [Planctomycetota bacterium]|nr:hypothetical protein [Planctomycetota bacterium]MDA1177309.1 hypothetical protein [Planctomycetota bacterium]
MNRISTQLDLKHVRVYPVRTRSSIAKIDDILVLPDTDPAPLSEETNRHLDECVKRVRRARARDATVSLIYGAHLVKNGAGLIVQQLLAQGWVNHLATNGAGTIHDWEFAYFGQSTESVRDNVATGCFGTWDETGKYQNMAVLVGNLCGAGYGESLGRMIQEDQICVPSADDLRRQIQELPADPRTPARADLLQSLIEHQLPDGVWSVPHVRKDSSILRAAIEFDVPLTVHPGIGYDIIATHPMYQGGALGRASAVDFARFGQAVENLEDGVVLSVGSAIMGPQVFEKSVSCVNNLRLQHGRPVLSGHYICVVDLQDGGGWDWTVGEPPATNPAYYLRFCKSYSRMGGQMQYLCCDNLLFLHHLYHRLCK